MIILKGWRALLKTISLGSFFEDFFVDSVGFAMIVGGAAFLFCGLIFLIPRAENRITSEAAFEEKRQQVEQQLSEKRRDRGEIDG
jgi:uncharacterized membrane-anchored protein